ncbi:MAG TPA: hypothetical protein VGG27_09565 [Magnetospirillaceae bacterium]
MDKAAFVKTCVTFFPESPPPMVANIGKKENKIKKAGALAVRLVSDRRKAPPRMRRVMGFR